MAEQASRVIWDWREKRTGQPGVGSRRNRIHGFIQALIALAVGSCFFIYHHPIPGFIVVSIGGFVLAASQFSPMGLYLRIQGFGARLGQLAGTATAYLLLIPVYWLFFTPFHLCFRRGAKNKMRAALDRDAQTYWLDREPADPEQYQRQF